MNEEQFRSTMNRGRQVALALGVLGVIGAIIGYIISGFGQFMQSYLFSYIFWLGVSLGLLAIVMMYFVAGGHWAYAFRGIAEAGSRTIWLMVILFIPIAAGLPFLYSWARPAEVAASQLLQAKSSYLNPTGFILRAVIYFVIWLILSMMLSRFTSQAGVETDPNHFKKLRGWSAAGLILYVLSMSFAAIDWIMSLQPEWSSTIFGLVVVLAQMLSAVCFGTMILWLFFKNTYKGSQQDESKNQTNRDIGAILLALIMGWAYMSFFQYLIIWAGNIPRETVWYLTRINNGWQWVAIIIALGQFALPFLGLLSMRTRSSLFFLAGVSAFVFGLDLLFNFWQVMPAFYPGGFHLHWLDIVLPIAIGGIWMLVYLTRLGTQPITLRTERQLPIETSPEVHL